MSKNAQGNKDTEEQQIRINKIIKNVTEYRSKYSSK